MAEKKKKWQDYVDGGVELPEFLNTPPPEPKPFEPFKQIVKDYKQKVKHQAEKLKVRPEDEGLQEVDEHGQSFNYADGYEKFLKHSGYYDNPYTQGDPEKYYSSVTDGNKMLEKHGLIKRIKRR